MRNLPLSCLLLLATAACAPTTPAPPAGGQSASVADVVGRLAASHWKLAEAAAADGARIVALFPRTELPLQLDFAEGWVLVSNACNHISGRFTVDGNRLSVGDLVQTEMACTDAALMQSDQEIVRRLQAVARLEFDPNDALVLTTTSGDTLRFTGEPTADTRYGGPGERVFLEVAAQRVPCSHPMIPDYQCLHVRDVHYDDRGIRQQAGEWRFFYDSIEGYEHGPGIRNVLRLRRYRITNPPADASSVAYVLDMVVESELVDR